VASKGVNGIGRPEAGLHTLVRGLDAVKSLRLSIQSVMAIVIVVAIDCMTLRVAEAAPRPITGVLSVIAFGSLPMANLLAFGLLLRGASQGRWKAFWTGFTAAGSVALLGLLRWAILTPNIDDVWVGWADPLLSWMNRGHEGEPWSARQDVLSVGLQVGLPLVPQGLFALLGGALFTGFRRCLRPIGDGESARRRPGIKSGVAALVIVAIPAIAVEGVRRWEVEPRVGRLAAGSRAVIDRRIGPIDWPNHAVVGLDSGWRTLLLASFDGVAVRVESDREPAQIETWQIHDGSDLYLEMRMVKVTLLEGPKSGRWINLERCWLKPR
jgi:hypothetical protein